MRRWLVNDLPAMFDEQSRSAELHLIEAVQLMWEDLEFAEKTLKD
jgi:Fe-S-cluster formation regulator IscX/YfhJ